MGLNALCGVDHQQCTLAGGNGTRYFIREIDMPGRVDQVQHPLFASICIVHLDRMALDGDSALAFEIHIVEHLGLHVFGGDCLGVLEQSVGEGTFPVVDVGDDAEVAYVVHIVKCSLEGMISARKSKIGYGLLHFRPPLPSHAPKSVAARRSSLRQALESPTDAVALYIKVRAHTFIYFSPLCMRPQTAKTQGFKTCYPKNARKFIPLDLCD